MIIITGGAGFIGSAMVWELNRAGINDIVVFDDLGTQDKWLNLRSRELLNIVGISESLTWLSNNIKDVDFVIHMGACSTTTELDADFLLRNNIHYSMRIFELCAEHGVPMIYASSAATYGSGELGYGDDPASIPQLKPINKYGYSKQFFDEWALRQKYTPPFWAGFKFFNVYGPQEYHKGGQASVVFHAFPQVRDQGVLRLFRSYRDDYAHGEQQRDFVYVKDVTRVMKHFMDQRSQIQSGIYNLGCGQARTFKDLGNAVFAALNKGPAKFDWIDMSTQLQSQYQYFTEADLTRLRTLGKYEAPFHTLEEGVRDYIQNYLMREDSFL